MSDRPLHWSLELRTEAVLGWTESCWHGNGIWSSSAHGEGTGLKSGGGENPTEGLSQGLPQAGEKHECVPLIGMHVHAHTYTHVHMCAHRTSLLILTFSVIGARLLFTLFFLVLSPPVALMSDSHLRLPKEKSSMSGIIFRSPGGHGQRVCYRSGLQSFPKGGGRLLAVSPQPWALQ